MPTKFDFRVSIENQRETGEIVAVYLQIRKGRQHTTKEYADGALFADYDRKGQLLGIEVLAPCEAKVLASVAKQAPAKRFLRESVPRGMLVGT